MFYFSSKRISRLKVVKPLQLRILQRELQGEREKLAPRNVCVGFYSPTKVLSLYMMLGLY